MSRWRPGSTLAVTLMLTSGESAACELSSNGPAWPPPSRKARQTWSRRLRIGRDVLLVTELTDNEPLLRGTERPVGIPAHLERGLEHDQAVGEDRAALDVEEVMAKLPGGAQIRAGVAAPKLRPAGDARLDEVPARVVGEAPLQLANELGALGPGADQGHLATEDVPELGELVHVGPAKQPAEWGDPCVAGLAPPGPVCLRVRHHRPQLQDLELPAAFADPPLPVENRPPLHELDRDRGQTDQRQRQDGDQAHDRHVEAPLPQGGRGAEPRMHDVAEPGGVRGPQGHMTEELLIELIRLDRAHRQ